MPCIYIVQTRRVAVYNSSRPAGRAASRPATFLIAAPEDLAAEVEEVVEELVEVALPPSVVLLVTVYVMPF